MGICRGRAISTDLSVSPSLVTFLGSEERSSSTVLPHLDLGVEVHGSRLPWQKKRG